MHEMDIPVERCDQALKNPWIIRITKGSFVCISLAFMCLIGHYSISVMFGFIVVSVLCFMSLARFLRELVSPASGK
ncbi:hypothetical protein AB3A97_004503 [Vibrio alginolyticus]|nr:hypothetical protein [Vibrio harveyi]ELA6591958.1 hypothetical protein [Vibrio alginolyticus]